MALCVRIWPYKVLQVVWYLVYSFPRTYTKCGWHFDYILIVCTICGFMHVHMMCIFVLYIHVSIVQHSVLIDSQLYTMLIHGVELATNTQCCTMET